MYASVNDPKVTRDTDPKKPPGWITEAAFFSITLFLVKLHSDALFSALSFMTILLPMMIYFIFSIIFNILKFLKLLHTEEVDEEDAGILSPKQVKLLFTVARNLLGYFGIYCLAGELDKHIVQKELATANLVPAIAAIQAAFLI